jgi:alpha-tubulin suppressor-like RCC1 family protein
VSLSAGATHGCALRDDGSLWCWGSSERGKLGSGEPDDSLLPAPEVTGGTDWAQVSAGHSHTCAVKEDGRLLCWGRGDSGQLGTGSTDDSDVPVQEVTRSTNWAKVAAGRFHTCALRRDGRLFCWGRDDRGQLGIGRLPAPVRPSD